MTTASTSRLIVRAEQWEPMAWNDDVRGHVQFLTFFSADETPSGGLTSGLGIVPVDGWLGLHRHAPPETYVIIEGSGLMTLRGEEFPVRAGTGVHIPSYAEHGIRNTGSDELRIVYSFAADSMGDVNYQFSAGEPPAE